MEIIFLIVPILVILWVTYLMIKKGRREYDSIKDELRTINAMPFEMAKSSALMLLKSRDLFATVERQGIKRANVQLPQTVMDLTNMFSSISTLKPPYITLDLDAINYSDRGDKLLIIGRGMEGSDVEYELCISPNNDEIYEISQDGIVDPDFGKYSTIYHWILAVADEMKHK